MRGSVAVALLSVALAVAAVFAVWASVGDAPWEKTTACAVCTPSPAPTQEELEKIACLQGGGEWLRFNASSPYHNSLCGPVAEPCWACFHALR